MSVVDKLLDAEGAIQSEVRVPDLDRLLHEAASEIETLAAVNAELLEAVEMVRDADNDCRADEYPTMPNIARAKIDRAIAKAKGDDHA